MSDLGSASYFLGLELRYCKEGIHVSQKKYVENLLKEYNMLQCKLVQVPLLSYVKQQVYESANVVDETTYRRLIWELIYVAHSRPNIVFSVGLLARFMHKPTSIHQGATKHLLRYLTGTIDFGIFYKRSGDQMLHGFSDSD